MGPRVLSRYDDRPFLPLRTVVRMLRAAYRGDLEASPVRDPSVWPELQAHPFRMASQRARAYERKVLREVGAQQLLAHGVDLTRAGRLIRRVTTQHRGGPILGVSVAGLASMGRLHLALLADRGHRLRLKPAGWRPGPRSAP